MNTQPVRIALAQSSFLVGAIHANSAKIIALAERARDELQAQAVVFPELALTGYPPEDLLLRPGFHVHVAQAMEHLRQTLRGIDVIVGHPHYVEGKLYNAASVLRDGECRATYYKQCLPNYGVFDEKRYFVPGSEVCVLDIAGLPIGLTICEDVWESGPMAQTAAAGARMILNLNASPYHTDKSQERLQIVRQRIQENGLPLAYINLVGGQDELVFDGASFVLDASGDVMLQAPSCEETLVTMEVDSANCEPLAGEIAVSLSLEQSVYRVLVLGIRDYVVNNGFPGVVIGLSGGIDSALTLALAVDALGAERVQAVMMPSRYTSDMSLEDARAQAEVMGVRYSTIPIDALFKAFITALAAEFQGQPVDSTEENIQARIRGVILMAISNKSGKMVLTTGNKSEMAVGYATLYGDMAGGYAAIKDVPKTLVYRLARYRNQQQPVIPQRVLQRAPSAELAPEQKDSDSLPPYETLDPILERYVEQDQCVEDIVAAGFDATVVQQVARMVDRNEYKRRQAAPGVRISKRAFGRDRRYPLTSGYGKGQ